MIPSAYFAKSIFAHSDEDARFFIEWTGYLPIRKETTPYHSGPHSIRAFRAALKLTGARRILEIGFCLGHSATILLELGSEWVHSVDNSERDQTREAAELVMAKYNHRFCFDYRRFYSPNGKFDMIFIDGGHEFDDVDEDIKLGLKLKIPFFLFDDFWPHWGPGIQPAIEKHGLIPIAILGNLALCVLPTR
jgi:methyltransferase family protein